MTITRMTSQGFRIGAWWVPPFELKTGEVITLLLPRDFYYASQKPVEGLADVLVGKRTVSGFTCNGRAISARSASPPQGIRRWIQDSSASSWLVRNAGMSRDEAKAAVQRLGLGIDDLNSLAANPRTMLGLEAAWANGAEIIVFSVNGCDPKGIDAAFQAVRNHLSVCSAVLLSFQSVHAAETTSVVFPGSTIVEISEKVPVSV